MVSCDACQLQRISFLRPLCSFLLLRTYRNIFSDFFPFSGKLLCWNCFSSAFTDFRDLLPTYLDRLYFSPSFVLLNAIVHTIEFQWAFFPGSWPSFLFPLCDYTIAQLFWLFKTECCTNTHICYCANYRLLLTFSSLHWQMAFVCDILTVNLAALSSGHFSFQSFQTSPPSVGRGILDAPCGLYHKSTVKHQGASKNAALMIGVRDFVSPKVLKSPEHFMYWGCFETHIRQKHPPNRKRGF